MAVQRNQGPDPMANVTTSVDESPRLVIPALGGVYAALQHLTWPLLRVTTGLLLVPHGAQKLFGAFGGYGIAGTGQFLESVGYAPGWRWALLIGLVELVGGLMLAAGLATRLVAAAVTVFMANAVLFHLPNGFFWSNGGYEYPLLWTVAALVFAIRGGGELSVDERLGREI
jgi:putative oxidoreductase